MKRILALLMVFVLCLGLCACGEKPEPTESEEDIVASKVRSRITTEIALSYDTVGVPNITTYVTKQSNGDYIVTGKVTVKDKYGDTYTGKYDATVEVTPGSNSNSYHVDLELGKLYKN